MAAVRDILPKTEPISTPAQHTEWLTKKKGVPADRIIIFGWSLGGSIAAYLAGRVKAKGLVVESSFTSYRDIGSRFYPYMPVRWFARFNYPTIEYVRKVRCPVMIIHSRNDEMIPFEFGLQIYDAANEPKEFVEIFGGHNDGFLVSGDTHKKAWTKWLDSLKEASRGMEAQEHKSKGKNNKENFVSWCLRGKSLVEAIMNKNKLHKILNPILFVLFVNQAVTVLFLDELPRTAFQIFHKGGGAVLLILMAAHFILNFNWVKINYFSK